MGGPRAKFSWMPLRKLFAGGPDAPGPGCLIMGLGAADIVTDVEWIVGANIDTGGKLSGAAATGGAAGSEPLMFNSQFVVWVGVSKVTKPYLFAMVFSGVPCLINCKSSGKKMTEVEAWRFCGGPDKERPTILINWSLYILIFPRVARNC